jgi:predicted dehydrogenase
VFAAQGMVGKDESHTAEEVEAHLASLRAGSRDVEAAAAAHPSAGLSLRKVPVEPGEPLRLEIESFLLAARTRTVPRVSGEDGRAALALALEINQAIAEHALRAGL